MSLFILITLQLFLEVKTQGLPQAKLTVFPASVTDGEMRLVCEGFENRTVSECFFYPSGQENFTTPSVSCELSLTGSELIIWSGDEESSFVNTVCFYSVSELGKYITSAHSDEVSVRVRDPTTTSSTSPTTDNISTVTFSAETSQEDLPAMSTSFTMDLSTFSDMFSPNTPNSDILTNATNSLLESTATSAAASSATKPTTSDRHEINMFSNSKMLFFITVAGTGVGIVLVVLMGVCMYGCTRKQRTVRIWIESTSKENGVSIPMARSDDYEEEEAEYYSSVNFLPTTSEPAGDTEEQSNQTQVKLNPLYCSILTQPAINDSGDVYSEPESH
ncbi:uncharacterized protein LOC130409884 [Triplophysa dalaica]|uniref:uncharacterized protein LOC130409884 n=1 Tax=Triplophysa dalaica TaxID=1582913 RepID=UPI0024DFBA64|nr:uncharacterized protein LOC130409884 [Triplophysa dalaica]